MSRWERTVFDELRRMGLWWRSDCSTGRCIYTVSKSAEAREGEALFVGSRGALTAWVRDRIEREVGP